MKTDLTEEIKFYKTIIHNCKTVFDVGCRNDNVFYELDPTLDIHLFDPNPNVYIQDELPNVPNIHFNNFALGNKVGDEKLHYNYGSIIHRTEEPKFEGIHQSCDIKIDTLENYYKGNNLHRIDLLKIDTEGYDFEVIKGCGRFLLDTIRYIQFEDWQEGYAGGETVADVMEFFKDWNIYKIRYTKPINYVVTKELLGDLSNLAVVRLK